MNNELPSSTISSVGFTPAPPQPHTNPCSRHQLSPSPVCIGGTDVDLVESYKYLGVVLDDKLEYSTNYLSNSGVKYSETTDGRFSIGKKLNT